MTETPKSVPQTTRRSVLRGSVLAGAAAATGSLATSAGAWRAPAPNLGGPSAPVIQATARARSEARPVDLSGYARVKQELVAPPLAPQHEQVANGDPKIVEITMEVQERKIVVDQTTGASIWAQTYNGTVPGPLIIVHEGDYVELTLSNPSTNKLEHNIDFHAATGALGGGDLTHLFPGEQTVLRWKAIKPGVFTYHCAPGGPMIPYHVCHGMNGAIMVLPRDGLKDVDGNPLRYDEVVYIGEQDFYLPKDESGKFKSYNSPVDDYSDSLEAMRTLTPTHVVFNGVVGALTGGNALQFEVGQTILMVHNQSNRDSRPHLIGGHGNFVWERGSFNDPPQTNLETWFVRGGSAAAAMYTFRQPGLYVYLNHNLIEAMLLGAAAHFNVDGPWDNALMEQVKAAHRIET